MKRDVFNFTNQDASTMIISYTRLWAKDYPSREQVAINTIEQILGINLIRQHPVGSYRVDGYDPKSNTVYEIDEDYHKYNKEDDSDRQHKIQEQLGCSFIRINI